MRSPLLEGLLGRQTAAVLSVLLARPETRLYQRQVAQLTGLRLLQAQRALRALAEAGVLRAQQEGNRVYYFPNPSCPILGELTAIVLKTAGLVEVLRAALRDLPGLTLAFVYGSLARQEQTPGSDVDLLVVGKVSMQQLSEALPPAEETLAREVNPTIYSEAEFRKRAARRHHFVTDVLEHPKLFVIGDADVLDRLVGERMGERIHAEPTGNPRSARGR